MAEFFAELKRRQMFRVAAAYAVVAWLLLQLINNLTPALRLPDWAATFVVVLLVAGFPITLLFCWIQHLASAEGSAPSAKAGKPDWLLIGALAVVLALMGYQQIAPASRETTAQAGVDAARKASESSTGVSLAVLPFANLSGEANQEFFSDGITEEITAALAKVPDLKVVARTSAFQFKGENRDIQVIGQQLRATHLIEGSVRKAGERVRITAQLISVSDGTHVWSESYDRELNDIFAIQGDIARAIATSLRMPLGLQGGDSDVQGPQNLGTYQEYLQAKAWLRDRGTPRSGPYLETLESVVARDAGFAPAWAVLSRAYSLQITASPEISIGSIEAAKRVVQSWRPKAEEAAQTAIRLDPRHPAGYWAMAVVRWQAAQWAAAEDFILQGLAVDPNDPELHYTYSNILQRTGRSRAALEEIEKVRQLEPLIAAYDVQAAMVMQVAGQTEAAIALFETIPEEGRSPLSAAFQARAYAVAGRYAEATQTLMYGASKIPNPAARRLVENAAAVLRTAPSKVDQKALPDLGRAAGDLFFIYASLGAFDRVMDYPEREAQIGYLPDSGKTLWVPALAPVRKTERFKAWARSTGIVDYWRTHGWADLCRPVGADDFVCD